MKLRSLVVGFAVASLALTACGQEGSPGAAPAPEVDVTVAEDFTLPDSPVWTAADAAGTLTLGVRDDQPGLGFRDATTQEYAGFDI